MAGDRVLMLVDRATAPTYAPTVFPLEFSSPPSQATQGVPVTVTVNKYNTAGTASAASGVTVTGASSPATTNASGQASLTFNSLGTFTIKGTTLGGVFPVSALLSGSGFTTSSHHRPG